MPELPEVETIRRQLEQSISGKKIADFEVYDRLLTAPEDPEAIKHRVKGRTVVMVNRRGKYLLLSLDSGDTLVFHLRMTGRLSVTTGPISGVGRKHLRLLMRFLDGTGLAFHDTRRFGKAFLLTPTASDVYWKKLGPEPLERNFNSAYLNKILKGRSRPIKSLLLDQSIIAGIGNIYADESLFLAKLHPLRPSGGLDERETQRLTRAIKETLRRAISLGGSSIDTYRDSHGKRGRFQETFRVHRRQNEPCPKCKHAVTKIRVGGRGTYFCPRCQLK